MKVGSTYPTSITLNLIDHVAINIVQSLKDQFSRLIKRWLSPGYVASWIGLTFCGVLFVALWGLFRVTNLQEQQSAQKDEMNNAIQLATSLEMELDCIIFYACSNFTPRPMGRGETGGGLAAGFDKSWPCRQCSGRGTQDHGQEIMNVSGQVQFRYMLNFRDDEGGATDDFVPGFQTRRTHA